MEKASIGSQQPQRRTNTKSELRSARNSTLGKIERKSFQQETTGVDYCDYTSKAKALPQRHIIERKMLPLEQGSQAPCYILSCIHKKIKIKGGKSPPLSSLQITGQAIKCLTNEMNAA